MNSVLIERLKNNCVRRDLIDNACHDVPIRNNADIVKLSDIEYKN